LVLQSAAARAVVAGGPDELLLLEHPPVVTLGRGGGREHLRIPAADLARHGVALVDTDRGGGATYHGPGQIVGYPIVDLRRRRLSPRGFLRVLETALAGALIEQGLPVFLRAGLTGVWASSGKVAAIGVSVRRGITRHGFALNVDVDLDMFDLIVPCGLTEPVTSLRALGWRGHRGDLTRGLANHLGEALSHSERSGGAGHAGYPSLLARQDSLRPPGSSWSGDRIEGGR
jgi:lipoate-protein ligase B